MTEHYGRDCYTVWNFSTTLSDQTALLSTSLLCHLSGTVLLRSLLQSGVLWQNQKCRTGHVQPSLTVAHALSLQTQSLQALVPVRSEQRCPARARLPAPPLPALPSCAGALGSASSTSPLRATRVCPGRQLPGHAARRTLQHPLVSSRTLLSSTQPLRLALPRSIRHCGEKRSKATLLQICLLQK